MMANDEVDAHKEEFVQLLNSFRIPEVLQEHIFSKGFDCTADFAFAFPSVENLNPFLLALPETDWHTLDTDDPLSSVHASRVRQAWNACRQNMPKSTTLPAPPTVDATPSPATWTEMLPPKLTEEAVRKPEEAFRANYPGELLDSDTSPSIRLLSLVHHGLKPGQAMRWVPWQLRLSARQYQEIMVAKSSKAVRSEMQLLSHAFFDDTPEVSVDSRALSAGWLVKVQTIFRNAIALCQAAHLSNLKAFDKKVADLCLAAPDPILGLRTVNAQELLAADRKIWGVISELLAQSWSLDDALHEVTAMRNDLPSLLQLRPKVPRQPPPPPAPPRTPRARDKRPAPPAQTQPKKAARKGKGKGTAKKLTLSSDWIQSYQGKEVRKRYQVGKCQAENCKFAHVCAVPGCQKPHPAKDHTNHT